MRSTPMIIAGHKRLITDFSAQLAAAAGDNLVSIILFGSAARGNFGPRSLIDVCVILNDSGSEALLKVAPVIKKRAFRTINILFFTEKTFKRSAGVFPIEFLDMKDTHEVIVGGDVFAGLSIDLKNLSFQCEHELNAKLLLLKKAFVNGCMRAADVRKAVESCNHVLKNLYPLKTGDTAAPDETRFLSANAKLEDLIDQLERIISSVYRIRTDA
jgi:predicted nucleotidyltransferase